MKGFKQEGVSAEDLAKLDKLIDGNSFDLNYEGIRETLLKYMSHKEMYQNDYDRWEKRTWEDEADSSAPYCPFCAGKLVPSRRQPQAGTPTNVDVGPFMPPTG